MTQPTKPTLTASDPPGWYECRLGDDTVRCPVWWDGYKLWPSPDAMASLDVTLFDDFRRLVYAEFVEAAEIEAQTPIAVGVPTPQPGVAELVAQLVEVCQTLVAIDDQPPENRMAVLLISIEKARDALAAVEAADTQERGE